MMDNIQLIYWVKHEMYYVGFDVDTGSVWTRHKHGGLWLETEEQQLRHMKILNRIEGIPVSELQIKVIE